MIRRTGTLLVALGLAGCSAGPRPFYVAPDFVPPDTLAVLPMNNHSTDLTGPEFVRKRLHDRLRLQKRYQLYSLESVDERLRALGVTDGGQLGAFTPQKVAQALGAKALVYGDLLEYGAPTTGVVNVRRVKAKVWMIRASDGARIWEAEAESAEGEGNVSALGAAVSTVKGLTQQLGEKASGGGLATETEDLIYQLLESLPPSRD